MTTQCFIYRNYAILKIYFHCFTDFLIPGIAAGVAGIVAAPFVLTGLGFGTTGVAAGSIAASVQVC